MTLLNDFPLSLLQFYATAPYPYITLLDLIDRRESVIHAGVYSQYLPNPGV